MRLQHAGARQGHWLLAGAVLGSLLFLTLACQSLAGTPDTPAPVASATADQPTPSPTATAPPAPTPMPLPPLDFVPEGALARFGTGFADDLAISPDGERAAVAGTVGVSLYGLLTLEQVLVAPTGAVARSVTFSPDGRMLAVGLEGGVICLMDGADGSRLRLIEGASRVSPHAAFSPDGSTLAFNMDETSPGIGLWDIDTGVTRMQLSGAEVEVLAYSPDGTALAGGTVSGSVEVWDPSTGELLWSDRGAHRESHGPGVRARTVACLPRGRTTHGCFYGTPEQATSWRHCRSTVAQPMTSPSARMGVCWRWPRMESPCGM